MESLNGTARYYLAWVKVNIKAGNSVTIGVVMNMLAFYNISAESYGSINNDLIVPVVKIDSP